MHRLLPDHAMYRSLTRENQDALPDQDLRVPTADAAEIEEAIFIDVRDLEPDLVDVPREHHARSALGVQGPDGVAVHVGPDVVGELADFVAPHAGRCLLEPRWPGRIEELLEESDGLKSHDVVLVPLLCRYGVYCRRRPVR